MPLLVHTDEYMRRHLRKGVPSLGNDLASLFEVEERPAGQEWAMEEGGLGRPAPMVVDPHDLRKHETQQMVMSITKRSVDMEY